MLFQASTDCAYKADGQLVCKKKKDDDTRKTQPTPIPRETFREFDYSNLLVLASTRLLSKGGVSILNPGNRMYHDNYRILVV